MLRLVFLAAVFFAVVFLAAVFFAAAFFGFSAVGLSDAAFLAGAFLAAGASSPSAGAATTFSFFGRGPVSGRCDRHREGLEPGGGGRRLAVRGRRFGA